MKTFRDVDAHAAEKAVLLRALRRPGIAVLDADDPRVAAMAGAVRGTVVRVGTSPERDVWAEGVTSAWPRRLEFDVRTRDGESCRVATRLIGTHWCRGATAALAAARALGVPLAEAAGAVATVEPFLARMQPVLLPCGAVVVRDEYEGSVDTFEANLAFLAAARAERRIAVVADVSDFGSLMRRKRVAHLGEEVGRVAEIVVFVGHPGEYGRRGALRAGVAPEAAHAFRDLRDAARFLAATLRRGDLVLLKGRTSDHLSRLLFAQLGEVRCWKETCDKVMTCDRCPELGVAPADRARARNLPAGWPHDPPSGSRSP